MRILFWNINKSMEAASILPQLLEENDVDILLIAEGGAIFPAIYKLIGSVGNKKYFPDSIRANPRLDWFSTYQWLDKSHIFDGAGISIKEFYPPVGESVLIAGMHSPSLLHRSPDDLNELMRRNAQFVREAEEKIEHKRTVVVGDFNLNPHERGLISSESFHATMDKNQALKGSRTVNGQARDYFYNPMWSIYGSEKNGILGTYRYHSSSSVELFWHCFDQVLLRPSLIPRMRENAVVLISEIDGKPLYNRNKNKIEFSDHLPILLNLKD